VLPWGSPAERERADRIGRGIGQAVVPKSMALDELATLFAHARGVIGLDSGLTHLAAAVGVPTVGIFCASNPALTGLYGSPAARNVGAAGRPPEVFEVLEHLA
jgi:heptosyltransferase-1